MELPEKSTLEEKAQLERASFGDRFFALIVDNIIMYIVLNLFVLITMKLWQALYQYIPSILVKPFVSCIMLIPVLGYFAVYAQRNGGQTIGKRWNNLKVVDLNGDDLTLGRFLGRELIARGLVSFGLMSITGILLNPWFLTYLPALNKNKRALHDIIAGTQVVKLARK